MDWIFLIDSFKRLNIIIEKKTDIRWKYFFQPLPCMIWLKVGF